MKEPCKISKKPFYDWVGIEKGPPPKYELVHIVFDDDSVQPGWWTGQEWDTGKKIKSGKIIAWKRMLTHTAA